MKRRQPNMTSEATTENQSECVSESMEDELSDNDDDNNEIDDDVDGEEARSSPRAGGGRGVTLTMLMKDGIIEPGPGAMTVSYLGQRFVGDLLDDGSIQLQTTKENFNSPSAWAIHCKKLVNPTKRSGCGWGSVKYRGRKLDTYKMMWFNKQKPSDGREIRKPQPHVMQQKAKEEAAKAAFSDAEVKSEPENRPKSPKVENDPVPRKTPIAYANLGPRSNDLNQNSQVECITFQSLGKLQPYTITISTNCLFLVDFHSHLTTSEVVGYLAGTWDPLVHRLSVQRAFPCRCRLADKENALIVEEEIRQHMSKTNLSLVGWYHSHPTQCSQPTLKDIDSQLDYQVKLNLTKYHPCIGLICSPYDPVKHSTESAITVFMAMPPEMKSNSYGMPMSLNYTTVPDSYLSQDLLNELKWLTDFYYGATDLVEFSKIWHKEISFLGKMKKSLSKKLPQDQTDARLLELVGQLVSQMHGET